MSLFLVEMVDKLVAMDTLIELLSQPFSWGLLLGLGAAVFVWRTAAKDKKFLKVELKRVSGENSELQGHLSTQLKINAKGNEQMQNQLDSLKEQNETLRANLNALQQKAGRAELRRLDVMEAAVSVMREQAPGFAQAWEKALREAENEQSAAESGLKKLMRKVVPSFRPAQDPASNPVKEIEG